MTFSERSIEYADLLVPMNKCPLGEAVPDCPFAEYWKIKDRSRRAELIEELAEEKLNELRDFHRKCLAVKIEKAQEETTRHYKKQRS